jgi:hypothetical protein
MTILDDRFDSSEVYLMKKMVRWALAFATVMAVPTSAMALVGTEFYGASVLNGAYSIPVGTLRFTLDAPVDGLYDSSCSYFVRWVNATPYIPSACSAYMEEVVTPGQDNCEDNAYHPVLTILRLSTVLYPDASYGYDKFQIKRKMYRIMMGEDYNGNFNGMCHYHPASVPYGMKLDHGPTP